MHYKWMVGVLAMPMDMGQIKNMVLAREHLANHVVGRELRNRTMTFICKFLLEGIMCFYGCAGKMVTNRGELSFEVN